MFWFPTPSYQLGPFSVHSASPHYYRQHSCTSTMQTLSFGILSTGSVFVLPIRCWVSETHFVFEELKQLSFSWVQLGYLPLILMFSARAYVQTCSRNNSSHSGLYCCSTATFLPWPQPEWPTRMSQIQFHCPASPMPAAPALLQLGQPQPSYSIPCGSGTLPSENASQPIRNSALPAGSATPYNTTTGFIVIFCLSCSDSAVRFCADFLFVFVSIGRLHGLLYSCMPLTLRTAHQSMAIWMSQCLTWQTLKRRPPCVWWMS